MTLAYIALGSNLNQPAQQLQQALLALAKLPHTQLVKCSAFYQSKPMGPQDQPDYVNAVASLETQLSAIELLDELQAIEQQQGRTRLRRWGERTLDLDILLFGELELISERLTIPHYHMCEREFVMIPLLEIAPNLVLPNGKTVQQIAEKFNPHQMQTISIST